MPLSGTVKHIQSNEIEHLAPCRASFFSAQSCFHSRHCEAATKRIDFVYGQSKFSGSPQHRQAEKPPCNVLDDSFGRLPAILSSSNQSLDIVSHEIHHDLL